MENLNYKVNYKKVDAKLFITETKYYRTIEEVKIFIASLTSKEWKEIEVLKNDPNLLLSDSLLLWSLNKNGQITNHALAQYELCYSLKSKYSNSLELTVVEKEKEEEVEITEGDIEWIGDNIFHIVCEELIKSKGNPEHVSFNFFSSEFIKRSWDGKSQFILSYARVYPMDAVEKYLAKDGRTVQDVFELSKQKAIEDYNE